MRVPIVLFMVLLWGATCCLKAEPNADPGDEYYRGYLLKSEADRLEEAGDIPGATYLRGHVLRNEAKWLQQAGDTLGALRKYFKAYNAFSEVAQKYPDWQSEVVKYRLKTVENTILKLLGKERNMAVPPSSDEAQPPKQQPGRPTPSFPTDPLDVIRKQFEEQQRIIDLLHRTLELEHRLAAPLDPGVIHS